MPVWTIFLPSLKWYLKVSLRMLYTSINGIPTHWIHYILSSIFVQQLWPIFEYRQAYLTLIQKLQPVSTNWRLTSAPTMATGSDVLQFVGINLRNTVPQWCISGDLIAIAPSAVTESMQPIWWSVLCDSPVRTEMENFWFRAARIRFSGAGFSLVND